MSRNLMVLFLFVAVICATATSNPSPDDYDDIIIKPLHKKHPIKKLPIKKHPIKPKCGVNEVWKPCGMPISCQPSCKIHKPVCHHKLCVEGCVCKDGLLRNWNGKCVPRCQCDC